MTREEAVAMFDSKWWEDVPLEQAAHFQLFEERLCMPFDKFHEGTEKLVGRPVFSHEFAYVDKPIGLRAEVRGATPPPTLQQILELIPAEKRIVVAAR